MNDSKEEVKENMMDNVRNRRKKGYGNDKNKSQINAEYFQALEQWLSDVRSYRYSCNFLGFPYSMMTQQMNGFSPPNIQNVHVNSATQPPTQNQGLEMYMFSNQQNQPNQTGDSVAVEYTIPPLWKRFMAETVDFLFLFIMKLAITFIVIDSFDLIDLDKYEYLHQPEKLDIKTLLEVTSEITYLEVIHRLIVCLYEGVFLRKGIQNQLGGATPGKAFMGIRVVFCRSIEQVNNQPNIVKVTPACDLGFGWAFARALLKNLVNVLLFPICFPFYFNKFNRTAYDILCHSVVVEDRVMSN